MTNELVKIAWTAHGRIGSDVVWLASYRGVTLIVVTEHERGCATWTVTDGLSITTGRGFSTENAKISAEVDVLEVERSLYGYAYLKEPNLLVHVTLPFSL